MIDNDEVLESMQADILGILQHTPSLKGHVLKDTEGDFNSRLEKSLGTKTAGAEGKRGLAIIVLQVDVTDAEKNLPGPPLMMRVRVLVIENIVINRSATKGTLQRSSQAALNILNTLQLTSLGSHVLYAEKGPIAPQTVPEGLSSHMVTLFVQSGMNPLEKPSPVRPQMDALATLVITGTTGANGTLLASNVLTDGRDSYNSTGGAIQAFYSPFGKWVIVGTGYRAEKVSTALTPVGLTGWTLVTGTGQPVVAAGAVVHQLSMFCESAASSIRYTTDGSFPGPDKTLYSAPMSAPAAGTLVRAAAYVAGMPPSDILEFKVTA